MKEFSEWGLLSFNDSRELHHRRFAETFNTSAILKLKCGTANVFSTFGISLIYLGSKLT